MIKQVLAGGSLLFLVTVGSLPASAQTPAAPAQAPAAPAAPATAVSNDELKKFAGAVKQILLVAQDTEAQMVEAVKKEGLSENRFNEIYLSKKDPAKKPATQVTPKEEQSYNQAVSRLGEIQKAAQTRMDGIVTAQGLQVDRFNQIFTSIQKDPKLRQQVQQMISQ